MQLELFKKDTPRISPSTLKKTLEKTVKLEDIQLDDRLFYMRGGRKYYGVVVEILSRGKFFTVEDLGVRKKISRGEIIIDSIHRWT